MSVRQELATAASTPEGITVSQYFEQTTTPGRGFVRLERIDYPPKDWDGLCRWNVVILLPQGYAEAEKYFEQHIPAVRDALDSRNGGPMFVTSVVLEQLDLQGVGAVPCVFINGSREED